MKFLILIFSLSVTIADQYENNNSYSGPLAGALPLIPSAISDGLVPAFSPDVAAARAEFASLGDEIIPAPMAMGMGPASTSYSSPSSPSYASSLDVPSSGSGDTYSGPLAGVFSLVPGAASGGLVPAFSTAVASARAEFASLGGAVIPAPMDMDPASTSYSSPSSSGYESSSDVTNSESMYTYSGPLAGVLPLVPGAASGGLVPAFSTAVASARAEFATLGGAVIPAPMDMDPASTSYSSPPSSGYESSSDVTNSEPMYTYSGPLAGGLPLVSGGASGGLVPAFSKDAASARAEFASLEGEVIPTPMAMDPASDSYSSPFSSSYSPSPDITSSESGYTYSGPLAGVFPLVPGAASGGLIPAFSPDVAAARAEFASLGGTVIPAPMAMGSSSTSYSSPSSSSYASPPDITSSESGYTYSGPLAGVFPLVPGAASGGLIPAFSPDVAAARAEFASLGGTVIPAPIAMGSSSTSYSSPSSSSYASSPEITNSGSGYTYSGPLAGVLPIVPEAASDGLVPAFSPDVAAARAEFASLGGTVIPAAMTMSPTSTSYSTPSSSSYTSSIDVNSSGSGNTYSGPLAGVLPLVPGAASGGLVPAFSPDVAAARAEFASLGGSVNPAPMAMGTAVSEISSFSSSYGASDSVGNPAVSAPADNGYRYSGPLAGVPVLVPASASGGLVPADVPAVAAAHAEHTAAKATAAMDW